MNILDKIKLIIEARSFYVKKAFISQFDIMALECYTRGAFTGRMHKKIWENDMNDMKNVFGACGLKIKRLVKYVEDERRYGWVVWYI